MTEAEWLASEDPEALLRFLLNGLAPDEVGESGYYRPHRPSDRKLRLFACGYFRMLPPRHGNWSELVEAIGWSEQVADGLPYDKVPRRALGWQPCSASGQSSAAWVLADAKGDPELAKEATALLRDIVGNPFRPISLCGNPDHGSVTVRPNCPACQMLRTPLVTGLAQAAYDERPRRKCERCKGSGKQGWTRPDDSREPYPGDDVRYSCPACQGTGRIEDGTLDPDCLLILADALEEAGCGVGLVHAYNDGGMAYWWNDAYPDVSHLTPERAATHPLLAHLRSSSPHVRGCWALDLLLGKE